MSSTISRTNWRRRMAEKEAVDAERARQAALQKTEKNFPSNLVATARPVPPGLEGFAARAFEAEQREAQERAAQEYRNRRSEHERMRDELTAAGVFPQFRPLSRDARDAVVELDEDQHLSLAEEFPRHGRRRYSSEPDNEGWRTVIRYLRKKRKMTAAERDRKVRAEILGDHSEDASIEDADMNGDLTDRSQRRNFY